MWPGSAKLNPGTMIPKNVHNFSPYGVDFKVIDSFLVTVFNGGFKIMAEPWRDAPLSAKMVCN